MWTEKSLKVFGYNIQKVIDGEDLTRQESYEMFRQILMNLQPDLQQGAFLAALRAKGETPQEIAGAWKAIVDIDTNTVTEEFDYPLVENSGTGMDQLKTFNISSAAAIVAAAAGVKLGRHGARALTSKCGTVDLLESVGIDVESDVTKVMRSIKKVGIGLFNGMSSRVHPQSLARILSQIRFGSTLNIAASLASPCRPTHALRGVYSANVISTVCEVMKEIGYERAMIVHGFDANEEKGIDELSTIGKTVVHEFFSDGTEDTYDIAPEDVGLKRADYASIAATGDILTESIRFLKVICGIDHPECIDITCYNAGAILYIVDKVRDIRSGIEVSRQIIESGRAKEKLLEWVSVQADTAGNGRRRFLNLIKEANLEGEVAPFI